MNCFIYLAESIVQCDQIWQSYASLAESLQYWAIFFGGGYLLFGKILELLWQILYPIGQISVQVNGQMLKNNLAIWSHWSCAEMGKTK